MGADLAVRVARGEFADGFPGELELAATYGVSRGTIRSALRPLRETGSVTAQRGRKPRVIVGGLGSAFGPVYSLFASVQESGMTQRSVVLERRLVTDPAVAERLSLPPAQELFKLSRLRLADEEPFAVDHVWLPADRVRPLLSVDFAATALYKELRERCGITVDGGVEELRADTASALDVERLGCAPGAPIFRIERIGYQRGAAVELRCSHILGERYSVTATFGAGVPS
ncbi:GntR family transcriptional regulator [Cryobacterium sp. TMT1-21]|uniref:GntR family transcriptional regulator n=1 Tax=Cryobacterium shii TaxID=1259235 RepID=A0AAQ2C659_9MICO|nr:GntR family transcriptional regulator [Cryobacterium shii]TFC86921.1 GntR family transcriptional regulator [Cryobacterium sp. TmT2-59]TFD12040.1 GntR family transcriptional regulator [Cryobacterium sp. TMT1-21]TFD14662.1 GntR family transcriptional regulator [Cryobacterium sp. TMT4-10]TFD18560.1 GntR family transcriptional regulator [Cryobacterium sp. TMT2-23]TFD38011.1 GntR family transcriptional regulator [Cryobacterium sp. TMT2-10]